MGIILAKFRKQKTTAEILQNLEERIQQIEKYSVNTQEQKKRFVGNFLASSIGIYVVAFLIFYFVYFPATWKECAIYSVPLLLFPVVIILLRMLFTWYFQRKLNKNSVKLNVLRAEKKKILEKVMDTETYKVAVNLLSRFGEKSTNGSRPSLALTPKVTSITPLRPSQTTRGLTANNQLNTTLNRTGLTPREPLLSSSYGTSSSLSRQLVATTPNSRNLQEIRRRTPFPIVNQQGKGVFERIVDVIIGDGPQDRYAMICKDCFAHNGMALKEEFDFVTFRCAFCNALNPSRKSRPVAPPLLLQHGGSPNRITTANDSSDSSSTSDNDENVEKISTELPPAIITTEANLPEANNVKETETESVEIDNAYDADADVDADDDVMEELNKENESESDMAHIKKHLDEDSKHNDEYKKEM